MPREVVYKPPKSIKSIYPGGTIKPPEYMRTYQEFLLKNSIQIIKSGGVVGGGNIILYTVPAEHFFYLTNLHINGEASADSKICNIEIDGVLSLASVYLMILTPGHLEISYNQPLKLDEGQSIKLSVTDATCNGWGTVNGFLVKKNLL